jgi:hypothetical protein
MNKKLKAAFMLALLICISFAGQAQNGIKLNLKKGDKFNIEYKTANLTYMTNGENKSAINTEDIIGSTYEVMEVNQNIYTIKTTCDYMKFQITPPKGMEGQGQSGYFDSRKPEDLEGEFGENPKEIIGKSVVFTYDATAKKLISMEQPLAVEFTPVQVGPAAGLFPAAEGQMKALAPKFFGGDIPLDAKLEKGYAWDLKESSDFQGITSNVDKHFSITNMDPEKIFIELDAIRTYGGTNEQNEAKVSGTEKTKGKKTVDRTTGMLAQSIFEMKDITTIEGGNGTQVNDKTVTTTVTITKL